MPGDDQVVLGPGDDAAILTYDGPVLTSVDLLVEGVHFRRDWSEPGDVGRKAVAVNVADIEAMGGRAVTMVIGLAAPADLPVAWIQGLTAGIAAEAAAAGVRVVGGDTTRGRDITLSVTVTGVLDGHQPVRRSGAVPGQIVALVGRLGWAAAGLAVLGRGFRSPRAVVEAQRVPQVPYGAGALAASAGATAMIDISDGLLADLGHIAQASGVQIDIQQDSLDVPEPLQAVAAATGKNPYGLILTGGEDHALAATFPAGTELPAGWRVIGTVGEPVEGAPAVLVDGAEYDGPQGFDHFGSRA